MQRIITEDLLPCLRRYPIKADVDNIRKSLELHVDKLNNTRKLTYSDTKRELETYNDVINNLGNFSLSFDHMEKYLASKEKYGKHTFVCDCSAGLSIWLSIVIESYPFLWSGLSLFVASSVFRDYKNENRRKYETALAAHVCEIHSRSDKLLIKETRDEIINYRE